MHCEHGAIMMLRNPSETYICRDPQSMHVHKIRRKVDVVLNWLGLTEVVQQQTALHIYW